MFSNAEGSSSRNFYYTAVLWMAIGMSFGLFAALLLVLPDLVKEVPILEYFTFGRVRPVHTNLVMFGWLSGAYFATLFYMVPRLAGVKLYSERLGNFTVLFHNLLMTSYGVVLLFGRTMGREYAEQPWINKMLTVVMFGLVAYNVIMTFATRKEKELYVTAWYMLGAVITTPVVYIIGNQFLFPNNPIAGVNDSVANWFYGHNILGYWFTPVGIGAVYYLLPKMTGAPVWSHRLSMIGFWVIFFVYGPTGAHHLVNGPVPYWLQTVAIAFSVTLIIPVWTVLTNFYGTLNGRWGAVKESVPLKFLVSAMVFYFITCFQGPMQALRSVSAITHFTNWVVGHAHLALLGTFSFIMFASIYYALPRLTGREIWSAKLMEWHYWLSLIGFTLFFVSLTIGGLVQGSHWALNQSSSFITSVIQQKPYHIARAVGGTMILSAQFLFIYNIFKSAVAGKAFETAARGSQAETAAATGA
ncbi:MAG: cytochrome oxidase heme b and copper-binding subunit [Symbiobacteriaceae bacterium]|nr:cytochrome oxidase heme b and copper-binding subunit [Symbiobacteriaceae bacterium]